MTWTELLVQIKFEAEANASTDYDDFFLSVANETQLAAARRHNFNDFFTPNVSLSLSTIAETPLPSDWLRMDTSGRIRYVTVEGNEWFLTKANPRLQRQTQTRPSYYYIATNSIVVYPLDKIVSGDSVILNYYRKPDILVGASEVPVVFEDLIHSNCLARYLRLKESKRALAFEENAKDAFVTSVANNQ